MGGVNSRSDHESFSQMWLHVASSPSSHGHFLLSVSSVEIYSRDLGTAVIMMIYISKPEQVKVLAHSLSNVFLCIAFRQILFWCQCLSTNFCLQSLLYQWGQKQTLDLVSGFRFVHNLVIASELNKGWTHLYSCQKSVTAQLARGVPHCPETRKWLQFELLFSQVPEEYWYRRLTSALAASFSMTPLHPNLFYARKCLFSEEWGDEIWCLRPSVQSKMYVPMNTKC